MRTKKPAPDPLDMRDETRCTDAERDNCVEKLRAALVSGALPQDVALSRIGRALAAVVLSDLDRLTTDIRDHRPHPSPRVTPLKSRPRRCQQHHTPWVTATGALMTWGFLLWGAISGVLLGFGAAGGAFAVGNESAGSVAMAVSGLVSAVVWVIFVLVAFLTDGVDHLAECCQERKSCHGRQ